MTNKEALKKIKSLEKRKTKISEEIQQIKKELREKCDLSTCDFRRPYETPSTTDEYGRYIPGEQGGSILRCVLCDKHKLASYKEIQLIEEELGMNKLSYEDKRKLKNRTIHEWKEVLMDSSKKEKFILL